MLIKQNAMSAVETNIVKLSGNEVHTFAIKDNNNKGSVEKYSMLGLMLKIDLKSSLCIDIRFDDFVKKYQHHYWPHKYCCLSSNRKLEVNAQNKTGLTTHTVVSNV